MADSDDKSDPFMSVVNVANVNNSIKMTFSHNFMRHLLLYSNFASRLLEVKNPGNRMVLIRELTKIFEAAIDSNVKLDNKISYRQIPTLPTGSRSSPTNLSLQQNIGGNENNIKINGELLNFDNVSGIKLKLNKIYERGCINIKIPTNISFTTILVRINHNTESIDYRHTDALQRLP